MVLWVGRSSCKDPVLGKLTLQEAEVFVFHEPQRPWAGAAADVDVLVRSPTRSLAASQRLSHFQ